MKLSSLQPSVAVREKGACAETGMARDRSVIRVAGGHPWTKTTIAEVADCFFTPAPFASAAVWFRSTRASRGSLGPPSGSRERWTTAGGRPTRPSAHSRSCHFQCTPTCRAVGSSVNPGPPRSRLTNVRFGHNSSDDEPLVLSAVGRNVVARVTDATSATSNPSTMRSPSLSNNRFSELADEIEVATRIPALPQDLVDADENVPTFVEDEVPA